MPSWYTNWMASLPLIVMTVLTHVIGLVMVRDAVVKLLERVAARRQFTFLFAYVLGGTVLLVTALHTVEAATWSVAYIVLGALPDARSAMLYSLSAMTTYGPGDAYIEPHWQMMGAAESLNGMVLFGLTTVMLFSVIERIFRTSGS